MKRKFIIAVLAIAFSGASTLAANASELLVDEYLYTLPVKQDFLIKPVIGYRYDQFMWSTSNAAGSKLSEVTWKNKAIEAGVQLYTAPGDHKMNFLGHFKYGIILNNHSQSQDSDWDKFGEFARTFSKVKGSVFDASGAIGYSKLLSHTLLTYYLGLEFSRFNLKDYGLNYTINRLADSNTNLPLGQLSQKSVLNATYKFDNYAPWMGASFQYQVNNKLTITPLVKLYFFLFKGKSQWLLREDLRKDQSFIHKAYGLGIGLDNEFSYIANKDLEINVNIGVKKLTMLKGSVIYYFSDGSNGTNRLKDLSLLSGSVTVGVRFKL